MTRTIGIDPGTVSIDVCGLDNGAVFLDRSIPTHEALANPATIIALLEEARPALIAGPSGYGLPLTRVADATDAFLRLAYLAPEGESGGIGGLRTLARALTAANLPVVFTPGVIHLPSVPDHRKVNRVDMGTADKVCAAALAIHEQARRRGCRPSEVSFILLELGGAFSAALAVSEGRIVDGMGGSSGPIGMRAAGALDGEVAFLAGAVPKSLVFRGGITTILDRDRDENDGADQRTDRGTNPGGSADSDDSAVERVAEPRTSRAHLAREAFMEGAVKAVAALLTSVPHPHEIALSGRVSRAAELTRELRLRLSPFGSVRQLEGFARHAKIAAQGAALIAAGLAGGPSEAITASLGIREAAGTALDHLYVISPDAARRRLGLP